MSLLDTAGNASKTAKDSAQKVTQTTKRSTRKATDKAKQAAGKAANSAGTAATSAKTSMAEAAGKVKGTTKRAVASTRATRAAKAGLMEEAREMAKDAGPDSAAAEAIRAVDAMHYQVEVNKRALSVTALTKTLNERWENGWRLVHMLEQRGNTVLVFEKRS